MREHGGPQDFEWPAVAAVGVADGDRKLGCGCGCGKKRLTSKVELSSTGRAELVKGSEEECLYGSQLR